MSRKDYKSGAIGRVHLSATHQWAKNFVEIFTRSKVQLYYSVLGSLAYCLPTAPVIWSFPWLSEWMWIPITLLYQRLQEKWNITSTSARFECSIVLVLKIFRIEFLPFENFLKINSNDPPSPCAILGLRIESMTRGQSVVATIRRLSANLCINFSWTQKHEYELRKN